MIHKPIVYFTVSRTTMRSFMPDHFALMVVASSWWNGKRLTRPTYPVRNQPIACDCGGFLAHRRWEGFPYSINELADWALSWKCAWCATPDWPCEPEIAHDSQEIHRRINLTVEAASQAIQARPDVNWYPVLQGWTPTDYQYCYNLYHKTNTTPKAIGSLCRRGKLHDISKIISSIGLRYLHRKYHLFGVKLSALTRPLIQHYASSVDTAAWQFLDSSIAPKNQRQITAAIARQFGFQSRRQFAFNYLLERYRHKCNTRLASPQPALL